MIIESLDNFSIFSKAIGENGSSLGAKMSFLCSFIITEAALVVRLSLIPQDILAKVFIEQGKTIIASVLKLPDATLAAISSSKKTSLLFSFLKTVFAFLEMIIKTSTLSGRFFINFS